MASVDISHINLESGGGHRRRSSAVNDGHNENSDDESVCFSDADEGSCFYSTADGSYDAYSIACGSDHEIGVSESDCSVDIVTGTRKIQSEQFHGSERRGSRGIDLIDYKLVAT
ncbi:hypothetical protein CsSME_00007434 [Camellia sinensis var. sinensis]